MGLVFEAMALEVQRQPFFLRNILDVVRRVSPVLGAGNTYLVTSADGVREVLNRPADFLNGPVYAAKLKLGPLVLGMDVSKRAAEERSALSDAVIRAEAFGTLVRRHASEVFEALQPLEGSPVDLVTDVIEPVFVRSLCGFLGVGVAPDTARSAYLDAEPGEKTVAQWMRKLGGLIASSVPAPFGLASLTEKLAPEMAGYLTAQIEWNLPRGVVAGMRARGLTDKDDVVRCVGGMMLAGATLFKATALAVHKLVELGQQDAVVQADLPEGARKIVWEALRFHPPFPLLVRYCPRATTLSNKAIPADTTIAISMISAMFDPSRVENPDQFVVTRDEEDYLLFGDGRHRCLAEGLAKAGIPEVVASVFQNLTITSPAKIIYDGPAVANYKINVEPFAVTSHETGSSNNHPPAQSGRFVRDEGRASDWGSGGTASASPKRGEQKESEPRRAAT